MIFPPDIFVSGKIKTIIELVAQYRLPAVYAVPAYAKFGGLLAYGPNFLDNYRRAATLIDRILKGAKPADLPVEQPTKFGYSSISRLLSRSDSMCPYICNRSPTK